jgi:NAD+ synthase (glutamine-hydrolysing)
VPKTLIQHLIRWVIASGQFTGEVNDVLQAILDTEITPELVPAGADGKVQSTEGTIGPYALHDFTLCSTCSGVAIRRRRSPSSRGTPGATRRRASGRRVPGRRSTSPTTWRRSARWLTVFVKRYFATNQFKRSAMPNGPKVMAGGSLSPRGDWRMPSDANARSWLADIEANVPQS